MAKARPANVLQVNHEQAKALAHRVGETEVLRLLQEAEVDLQRRLQQAIQTGSTTPMNIATMEQTLAQVRAVTHGVAAQLGKVVLGASGKAATLGADGVLRYLQAAQQTFGGQARPLALREAAMMSRAVQGANASVLGRLAAGEAPSITYSRSPRAKADGDVLVKVPASKFDALWSRDDAGYLGANDQGIGKRREGVSAFVKKRGELYASQVVYDPTEGKVVVVDGRHRLATLRDAGAGELVVSVPAENLADFIKATGGAPALAHNEVKASVPGSLAPDSYEPPLGGVLRRYGAATIETFEGVLRTGILTRKPWGDMRDELVQASPFLQGQPKFWAERIARTETMAAYNRAGWEGLRAADDDLGDVVKVLSATFDNRTGWDSYQVHGQLRRTDEPFEWAGGLYQHPPNRPNDREVVVPHRLSWPIPHELHPRSDAEVMAAWKREQRRGSPPKRPRMSTIPHEAFAKG